MRTREPDERTAAAAVRLAGRALSPVLSSFSGPLRIPIVVFEIVLGRRWWQ